LSLFGYIWGGIVGIERRLTETDLYFHVTGEREVTEDGEMARYTKDRRSIQLKDAAVICRDRTTRRQLTPTMINLIVIVDDEREEEKKKQVYADDSEWA